MRKTWFITGAARGIGREIASAALEAGHQVVATARTPEAVHAALPETDDRLCVLRLDVTQPSAAKAAVQDALDRFGSIDILVNNAGYGQLGHFETIAAEAIDRQFSTNVFGLMNVTRAVLPAMRRQQSGHIFNMSSIGGTLGFDGAAIYCASKFAVEGFSESLALEIERFGIDVTIVEPGYFRTDFLDGPSVTYGDIKIDDYADAVAEQRAQYDAYSHAQPGDPARLARLIVSVGAIDNPPLRLVAGSDSLAMSRSLLDARRKELEAWADRSLTTDFPVAAPARHSSYC